MTVPSSFGLHQVCGAINRSLALQCARSVRVVLVLKEARGDVGNGRGGVLLKDVEHVASIFCRPHDLGAVGLIVTSEPRGLVQSGVAEDVSQSMRKTFHELLETARAEDDFVDLGYSVAIWQWLRLATSMGPLPWSASVYCQTIVFMANNILETRSQIHVVT